MNISENPLLNKPADEIIQARSDNSAPTDFLQAVFGDDAPGSLVLFALPGEKVFWNNAANVRGAVQQVEPLLPSYNLYFGVSLQDRDAAGLEWQRRNPTAKGEPHVRGYSSTTVAMPGVWTDIDVQSKAHARKDLPESKDAALAMLKKFPLEPSVIWDTGYGIQAFWLFRELWVFSSDEERAQARALARRFNGTLSRLAAESGWVLDNVSDLARLLRLPGSFNHKLGEDVLVKILPVALENRYNQLDFEDYLIDGPLPLGEPKPFSIAGMPAALAKATDALRYVPSSDYNDWLNIGMALHSADKTEGLTIWREWSKTCPKKFDAENLRSKWFTFTAPCEGETGKVTLGTLFALAKTHGWTPDGNGDVPWPGDADTPPEPVANGLAGIDEKENFRMIALEREPEPEPPSSLYPCPAVLWTGIFEQAADIAKERSWGVWLAVYSALGAIAHCNMRTLYHRPLYGMTYCLLVAPTGVGKGIYLDIAEGLLPNGYSVSTGVQSGEGLLQVLAEPVAKSKKGDPPIYRAVPAMLLLPELTALTKAASIENSRLIESLDSIFQQEKPFTIARSTRLSTGGKIRVANPMLSIFASTTPVALEKSLSKNSDLVSQGLYNRFFTLPGPKKIWEFYDPDRAGIDCARLKQLSIPLLDLTWQPSGSVWDLYEPDALGAIRTWGERELKPLMNEESDRRDRLARLHFYLHHIAVICSWQSGMQKISLDHAQAAIAATTCAKSFGEELISRGVDPELPPWKIAEISLEARILQKIRAEPGVTLRDLCNALCRQGTSDNVRRSVGCLTSTGQIITKKKGKREGFYNLA